MPTKSNTSANKSDNKAVQDAYTKFLSDMDKETGIKNRARLQYYNQRLDSALYGKDFDQMNKIKNSIYGINKKIEYADSTIKAGKFDKEFTPNEIKMILGDKQYTDYVTTKGNMTNLINPEKVAGTKNTDPLIYGMRNSFANPSAGHERTVVVDNKPIADFRVDMEYNPTQGYSKTSGITKEYAEGGLLDQYNYGGYMLPEYGFGSWLKQNAAGLLKGAGGLVKMIPGVGAIAGPIFDLAGSAVAGSQKQKAEQAAANKEQKALDAKAASDKQIAALSNMDIQNKSMFSEKDIEYGSTFALGGNLMMDDNKNVSVVTLPPKASKHNEGIGGVPVDIKGNPTKMSNQSAVGMVEGGELIFNGFVFSNNDKMKIKKHGNTYTS